MRSHRLPPFPSLSFPFVPTPTRCPDALHHGLKDELRDSAARPAHCERCKPSMQQHVRSQPYTQHGTGCCPCTLCRVPCACCACTQFPAGTLYASPGYHMNTIPYHYKGGAHHQNRFGEPGRRSIAFPAPRRPTGPVCVCLRRQRATTCACTLLTPKQGAHVQHMRWAAPRLPHAKLEVRPAPSLARLRARAGARARTAACTFTAVV